jgi:NAD(P)-dependent dehydrogenase (short-subunit alcohol dehydrogenase family)
MTESSPSVRRQFAGCVAIVTGSTSGFGLAIAHALAAEGADIVMNGFVGAQNREQTLEHVEKMRAELAAKHHVRAITGTDPSIDGGFVAA